jgi:hypothetical protein
MREMSPAKRAERPVAVPVGEEGIDGLGRGHVPPQRKLGGVDPVDLEQTSQAVPGRGGGGPAAHDAHRTRRAG